MLVNFSFTEIHELHVVCLVLYLKFLMELVFSSDIHDLSCSFCYLCLLHLYLFVKSYKHIPFIITGWIGMGRIIFCQCSSIFLYGYENFCTISDIKISALLIYLFLCRTLGIPIFLHYAMQGMGWHKVPSWSQYFI